MVAEWVNSQVYNGTQTNFGLLMSDRYEPGEEQDGVAPFAVFAIVFLTLALICRGLGLL
jgi:hypothetical protein